MSANLLVDAPCAGPRAAADSAGPQAASEHWLQVMSHVHPRYGGLSSMVPELGIRLAASSAIGTGLAAFCEPHECIRPQGYDNAQLTFWPASRHAWLTQPHLRASFAAELKRYDGVHIHGLWEQSTAAASRAARRLGKPYVLSAHGMLEPWARAQKRLKKAVYAALVERSTVARASVLHALTRAEAQHYIDFGACSPIAVIPNAVEVPHGTTAQAFLDRYPELADRRLILFMARLHPKKGLDMLVDAWRQVHATTADACLVVAGPDFEGMRERMEGLIASYGMRGQVVFTGMLDSAMKWSALAAAEAFVLPSHSEGLSVSVLEAMGVGLPVIVTKPCHMPEVSEHQAGWEVEPTTAAITGALQALLHNSSAVNQQMGAHGAALVAERYSYATVTEQMTALYRWVLSGGSMPPAIKWVHP